MYDDFSVAGPNILLNTSLQNENSLVVIRCSTIEIRLCLCAGVMHLAPPVGVVNLAPPVGLVNLALTSWCGESGPHQLVW